MANISVVVWMYALHLAALFLVVCSLWLTRRKSGRHSSTKLKCSGYFFWNGLIRLLMETSFELVLAAVLNIHMVDWLTPYPGVKLSTTLAVISLILVSVLPPFLAVLYWRNFSNLEEDWF